MSDEELKGMFETLLREVRGELSDLRHQFNIVLERLDRGFGLLAEGILNIDQKLDREAADIRGEMRHGFADTHELIKFTWSHLG
jgi:hypothetical protein